MDVVTVFIADPEASVLMQPGDSPLNHPTDFPQSTSMGSPSLGDLRCDLPSGQEVAHQLGVISPVALNTLGLPACTSLLSADSVDCIYQGDGLGDIGDVGACQPCRQGDTLGVGDQVLLTAVAGLASVRGNLQKGAHRNDIHMLRSNQNQIFQNTSPLLLM